jgi:hypothetical protein
MTTYGPRSYTKHEVLSLARFPSQAYESQRNSQRLSMHYTIKDAVFNIANA